MLTLMRAELTKLYRRRGTYVCYGVMLALVLAIAIPIFCYRESVDRSIREGNAGNSELPPGLEQTLAGPFIPRLMMFLPLRVMVVNTLVGFFAAIVGGGMLAGEYGSGTLRLLLTRPPARGQVVAAKAAVAALQSATVPLFLGLSAFAVGYAFFGRGPLVFLDAGSDMGSEMMMAPYLAEGVAVQRLCLAYGLMALGAAAIAAMGVFISSFTSHALTAAGLTFGVMLVSGVLGALGHAPEQLTFFAFFREIHPYLLTTHINVYDAPLFTTIDWARVGTSVAWLAGYSAAFIAGAVLIFSRRDIRC